MTVDLTQFEKLSNVEIEALLAEVRKQGMPQKIPLMRLFATLAEVPTLRSKKRTAPKKKRRPASKKKAGGHSIRRGR